MSVFGKCTSIQPTRRQLIAVHGSLLLTAALWGGNFAAIKELLKSLEPLDVVFVRAFGSLAFMLAFLLWSRKPWIGMARNDLIRVVLIGFVGITMMNLAMSFGQDLLPAAMASLIVTSNPIFTVLIAAALGQEMITSRKVVGIGIAFVGFLIVLLYGSGSPADLEIEQFKGVAILSIAPISWAIYTVLSKPLLSVYPASHVAAYSAIAGTVSFMSIPFFREGTVDRIVDLNARGWGSAIFASVFAYSVAYLLWYRGLRVLSPSQTAIYIYLVPVFGLLSAWIFLGEQITFYLLIGGATILAGVFVINRARTQTLELSDPPEPATPSASTTAPLLTRNSAEGIGD